MITGDEVLNAVILQQLGYFGQIFRRPYLSPKGEQRS